MTSVRKSPNMMSTTGRMPVIAAPRPMPEIPASEIGESITRSGPNSSTSPDITLNGVPASATSSPMMKTVGSRRSSSARASLTACASEISRVPECSFGSVLTLGVDVLGHLARIGVGRLEGMRHCLSDLVRNPRRDLLEVGFVHPVGDEPIGVQLERITLALPASLFFLRSVVGAVDVAHVVAVVAVCIEQEEPGPIAVACARDCAGSRGVDLVDVLAVGLFGWDAEGGGACRDVAGS